jgi:glycosyltransferase involved in cell wall biosynthesis
MTVIRLVAYNKSQPDYNIAVSHDDLLANLNHSSGAGDGGGRWIVEGERVSASKTKEYSSSPAAERSVPQVSVVMAARDAESFLDAAIAQIAAQTMPDFEVVVVDDASKDGTAARLAAWAAEDPRVTVLTAPHQQGVAASRNLAVGRICGTYVWFTDCDDRWSPDLLEVLVGAAEGSGADVVLCDAIATRDDRQNRRRTMRVIAGGRGPRVRHAQEAVGELLRGEIQGHLWNKLFRRELVLKAPFPLTRAFSDLGAMGHLLARSRGVVRVDRALYTYVIRRGSILNSKSSRPRDLLDCRDLVRSAVDEVGGRITLADDLRRFEFGMIYLAILNDLIRRSARDSEACAVRAEVLAVMTGEELWALVRTGNAWLAFTCAAVVYAHPIYAFAYRVFRRLKWGSVGYN